MAKKSDTKASSKKSSAKKDAAPDDAKGGKARDSLLGADTADLLRVKLGFDLAALDPRSTPGFSGDKAAGKEELDAGTTELADLQERLFAASKGGATDSVLLVLQAMDTAGKGGIVRHVVGAVDPQGIALTAFKAPTPEEQRHTFLWRVRRKLPTPGQIGVFDRSHYEDVLVHRVRKLTPLETIEKRYDEINRFERQVSTAGTRIIKVMLHISPEEQKARLGERLERPDKHWKYRPGDLDDRALWPDFQQAYQIAVDRTSTELAPWYVVPADRKWYARLAVQHLLLETLRGIDPQWPAADFDVEAEKARLAAL
ncbi:PPK2 family polyphosphate kinase [Tersicoccus sp. MR15.9]|uniref:PPK2 family polyphosphate kinase n=1 Tax=Tersicoccus mangrovi TaxID=3121635 RepID=UPI002FE6BDDF